MPNRAELVAVTMALASAGCRSLGPPPTGLGEVLRTRPDAVPGLVRRTARVRVESEEFTGDFQAVMIAERGPAPRVRMQLLPDLGSKVLDVVVTPEGAVGYWPHLARGFRGPLGGPGALGRGFPAFLSVSLLESAAPLMLDRVLAGRERDGGFELALRPAGNDRTRVRVRLDARGALVRRDFERDGVSWTEAFAPRHEFSSRGFRFVLEEERSEELAALPEGVFELVLPEGVGP